MVVVVVMGYIAIVVDTVIIAIDSFRRIKNLFLPPHSRKEALLCKG